MINIFTSQLALKNLQLSLLLKFDGSCILFSLNLENLGALNDIKLEMYLLRYPETLTVSTNEKRTGRMTDRWLTGGLTKGSFI